MATATLRPNGTVSNTGPWTITGVATAHDAVDDAVTQPTAATTTDNVRTSTSGHVLNLDLSASPSDVETVTAVTIWAYNSSAGNDRISVSLWQADGTTQIGTTGLAATNLTTTYTWYSHTISGLSLTKTQIDGARLRLTSGANGGMSEVRCAAAYVEITYTPTPTWPTYPSGSYPEAVTTTSGLVAYWRLGEASGTVVEEEANRFDGTNSGATIGATGLLTGDANTAYSFDGVNDSLNLGNPAGLQLSTGTIIAWIKTSGTATVIEKFNAWTLYLTGGTLRTYDYAANLERNSGVTVNDNQRHMVAMSFQSGVTNGTILYVDGSPVLTTTITVNGQGSAVTVATNGGNYFGGTIDELSINSAVLDGTAVATLWTKGSSAGGDASATITRDQLATSGKGVTVAAGASATITVDSLTASGKTVTATAGQGASATITADVLTASGQAVTFSAGAAATITRDQVAVTGATLTAAAGTAATITADALATTGQGLSVAADSSADTTPGTLAITGTTTTAGADATASITAATLTASGQGITVSAGAAATMTPQAVTISGQPVTAVGEEAGDATASTTAVSLTVSGQGIVVSAGTSTATTPDALTVTSYGVTGTAGAGVAVERALIAVIGRNVVIAGGATAGTTLGTLTITGLPVTAEAVPTVYLPWPQAVTGTVYDGPAIAASLVPTSEGSGGAIPAPTGTAALVADLTVAASAVGDAPAVVTTLVAPASQFTASMVMDGPAITATLPAGPLATITVVPDPITGQLIPGPSATAALVSGPSMTAALVAVPSGTGSAIPDPSVTASAVADAPAVAVRLYNPTEG